MKVVGLIAAKENSNRFPGKNYFELDGKPMFMHAVKPLLDSKLVDKVYVITDSPKIISYCEDNKIGVIRRPKNATRDEDKLISILRFGYYNLDQEYDATITVMANCPGYTVQDIDKGLNLFKKHNLKEVRGYDLSGVENGMLILDKSILESNRDISYYVGGIVTSAKEIHYKSELE